ncbi:DUF4181 domain-containing protein [Bacillus sp. FJAT-22090]|uniref:DUF4181 domain-containing protein n=1 Tax=Bacillus sp. FJAT-22090 TaxID=1581038 RepID=UPI0011A7E807|nr:DUF4181 domain-containing protein [Bacillus sp. FJAT-22090]
MAWGMIALFVFSLFVLIFIFNTIMAKVLKVEKRSLFSAKFVNKLHKKIEGILRITFLIIYIIFTMRQIESPELTNSPWYFLSILMIYLVLDELVRAFMEWKYAINRKEYIYTLSELLFIGMLIIVCAQSNFFGMIK